MSTIYIDGGSVTDITDKIVWDSGSVLGGVFISLGDPVSTTRAITGSTSTVTEGDVVFSRVSGGTTVTDYTWS